MKLELKHLAPYLPYGLKAVIRLKEDSGLPIDEEGIVTVSCFEVAYLGSEYDEFKPTLRPLLDLVNEIEVNGEKFIPLKKLHELDEINFFNYGKDYTLNFVDKVISINHNVYKSLQRDDFTIKYLVETSNVGDLVYSLTYSPDLRRFAKTNETYKTPLGIGYQLDLFNKLFEWHFDVFGLIEKGLAIDLNNLK